MPVVAVTHWSWTISQVPLVGDQHPVDDLGPDRAHPTVRRTSIPAATGTA